AGVYARSGIRHDTDASDSIGNLAGSRATRQEGRGGGRGARRIRGSGGGVGQPAGGRARPREGGVCDEGGGGVQSNSGRSRALGCWRAMARRLAAARRLAVEIAAPTAPPARTCTPQA